MLRIKDNIDLKELEKYGFELKGGTYCTKEITYSKYDGHFKYCWMVYSDRELYLYIDNDGNYKKLDIEWFEDREYATTDSIEDIYDINALVVIGFDTLYDLIKAGLVEKVEE